MAWWKLWGVTSIKSELGLDVAWVNSGGGGAGCGTSVRGGSGVWRVACMGGRAVWGGGG